MHPTHSGLPPSSSLKSWLLRLESLTMRGPPSAQSSVALAKSKNDGRSFSVPIFVMAVIVLNTIAVRIGRKWQAEWQLQHTPLYQQIAKSEPATFQRIRQAVLDGVENHRTETETSR